MDSTYFRIIFSGLRKDTPPDQLISYMKNQMGYSEDKIRSLLLAPPRVLTYTDNDEQAIDLRSRLEEKGARVQIEAMIKDSVSPFPISDTCHRRIRHELIKASQCTMKMALISVRIVSDSEAKPVPSLLSGFAEKIEDLLKGNVDVLPVDETRLVILDLFTDMTGTYTGLEKLDEMLNSLFTDSVSIFRGVSFSPQNGTDVSKLLQCAENQSVKLSPAIKTSTVHPDLEGRLTLKSIIKDGETATDLYQQMLISARGKKFKWLTEQDLDDLWLGLGGLPQVRQTEFLYRLPLDSPLVPGLEAAINDRKKRDDASDSNRRVEEILIKLSGFDNDDRYAQIKKENPVNLKKVDSFPTLSKVVATIVDIARNPSSGVNELTSVIKNDPALTLILLKVVNSAYYGFPQKIESIERAVVIIGHDEVVNLALGLGASQAIDIAPVKGLYQPKTLWHHLMGTALICRFLCKRYQKKDEPGLFTAGLLHDFGKIFLVQHYPDIYGKLHLDAAEFSIPLYELEEECFGINHAVIGKYIGSNWNLPEPLIQAAAYHHQPFFATEHTRLAAIIGIADYIHHRTCPSDAISQVVTPHSPCLTYGHWHIIKDVFAGIIHDDMDVLCQEAEAFIRENDQIFSILK
ncbi:MAG: HDOD domain-containing protein [Desulfobacteraceae bacterium]|nr:HDOD domain-containing protein [Desulfobacteraceae bacterium]